MQTLNPADLEHLRCSVTRWNQPDDDVPIRPEVGPLDSAQRKRWAAEGEVYAVHML